MTRAKAFTLIELLIVIAIIAILALIAVPNFLEAQVRAKVTRVMADQRSLALAIEAYTVDWGRHPIGYNEGTAMKLWTKYERKRAWNQITTPVGYIGSIPNDPFALDSYVQINANGVEERRFEPMFQYNVNRAMSPEPATIIAERFTDALAQGYYWDMYSHGPTRIGTMPWPMHMFSWAINKRDDYTPNNIYDASNGTISHGMIIRSNKGHYTGPGS